MGEILYGPGRHDAAAGMRYLGGRADVDAAGAWHMADGFLDTQLDYLGNLDNLGMLEWSSRVKILTRTDKGTR
jgi:hypothetical protein